MLMYLPYTGVLETLTKLVRYFKTGGIKFESNVFVFRKRSQ
jgi:hypothetical protein